MKARSGRAVEGGEAGQAVVESAIVMPAVIFLVLTILQLTMVQHARIMTEYAAFCAARAGVVFNADGAAMNRAATIALLPTIARTDSWGKLVSAAGVLALEQARRVTTNVPLIRGKTLSPTAADFDAAALTGHLNRQEIDFDDIRTAAVRPNQLQIEIKYNYRMRIPFANRILQAIYFAGSPVSNGLLNTWKGVNMASPEGIGGTSATDTAALTWGARSSDPDAKFIALAGKLPGPMRSYYFPLKATYTMRMQSNTFRNLKTDW